MSSTQCFFVLLVIWEFNVRSFFKRVHAHIPSNPQPYHLNMGQQNNHLPCQFDKGIDYSVESKASTAFLSCPISLYNYSVIYFLYFDKLEKSKVRQNKVTFVKTKISQTWFCGVTMSEFKTAQSLNKEITVSLWEILFY